MNEEVDQRSNDTNSRLITRRDVLKGAAAGIGLTTAALTAQNFPLLRAGLEAYSGRADFEPRDFEEAKTSELNVDLAKERYALMFGQEENPAFTFEDFKTYYATWIGMIPQYYDSEAREGESFNHFTTRYLQDAKNTLIELEVDPVLYFIFAYRSYYVARPTELPEDISISRQQIMLKTAETLLDARGHVVGSLMVPKDQPDPIDKLRNKLGKLITGWDDPILDNAPRSDGSMTLGAYDIETINFALAIMNDPTANKLFRDAYPEAQHSFSNLATHHTKLINAKADALAFTEKSFQELKPILKLFLGANGRQHLERIGIGSSTLDDWHRVSACIPSAHINNSLGSLETALENTHAFYEGRLDMDQLDDDELAKILFRDEILNPKFIDYFTKIAAKEGVSAEVLSELAHHHDNIYECVRNTTIAELEAAAHMGRHETDSKFQQLTTIAFLKYIQSRVQEHLKRTFEFNSRSDILSLTYLMSVMFDFPPQFMQTGRFGKLPTTKGESWNRRSPQMLDHILEFHERMRGKIPHPFEDMKRYLTETDDLYRQDPNTYTEEQKEISRELELNLRPIPSPIRIMLGPYLHI